MPVSNLVLPPQFLAVLALPEDQRYLHFLRKAANSERIWSLLDPHGWATLTDPLGQVGLPVWPHPAFAAACACGDWEGYGPACIEVPVFLDRWLPDMGELGVRVDVFPTTGRRGFMVSALQLELQLRKQLALTAVISSTPASL
ncbi:MAG: DUF2750 domain-containing protein [Burkholderiales bacterium]|nr:DUF2750 domain-containing protein [Burkholderiales bacterium]